MTKKHFQALADGLRDSAPANLAHVFTGRQQDIRVKQWLRDVDGVAEVCAQTNPRFDRARFLAACGVTAEGQ